MINDIKKEFLEAQKEVDALNKIAQLKIINNRLLQILTSPKSTYKDKEEAKALIQSLVFSVN
jgi:hypothetical protein